VLERAAHDLYTEKKQEEHLKSASKQISKSFPLLRERFCLEWMEGNITEEEVLEQLHFLQLPNRCPDLMGVIRWPEIVVNQPLIKEGDRQVFLFAIENIVSEWLESYEKVVFRDQTGLIMFCIWGEAADNTFTNIEKTIQMYLKISIQLYVQSSIGGFADIPSVYRSCKSNVYKDSQISPMVRRAKQYMQDHYCESELTLESFAQSMQVSPVYLSRMLKQELGTSFASLITVDAD
jgi:two-component system response regulator YesN